MMVFAVLALGRMALGVPRTGVVPHPIVDKVSLLIAVAMTLTGLALWRRYLWARWAALAWWLLFVGGALLIVRVRGVAGINLVGAVFAGVILLVLGFLVRHIWKHGPHVKSRDA